MDRKVQYDFHSWSVKISALSSAKYSKKKNNIKWVPETRRKIVACCLWLARWLGPFHSDWHGNQGWTRFHHHDTISTQMLIRLAVYLPEFKQKSNFSPTTGCPPTYIYKLQWRLQTRRRGCMVQWNIRAEAIPMASGMATRHMWYVDNGWKSSRINHHKWSQIGWGTTRIPCPWGTGCGREIHTSRNILRQYDHGSVSIQITELQVTYFRIPPSLPEPPHASGTNFKYDPASYCWRQQHHGGCYFTCI